MYEFIIVEFDEARLVLVDGVSSGCHCGEVIQLEPGTHTISLSGDADFSPAKQDVNPTGTSPLQPEVVSFTRV